MRANRNATRHEREVSDDVLHLSAIVRQSRAGKTARHAVVDAVLDRDDGARPLDVLRIPGEHTREGRGRTPASLIEMTTRATQVAGVEPRQAVRGRGHECEPAANGATQRVIG